LYYFYLLHNAKLVFLLSECIARSFSLYLTHTVWTPTPTALTKRRFFVYAWSMLPSY
jgi:hypothetical protein